MSGNALIYVAGNPDLYPLEYYDPESGSYQGAIPTLLAQFAREYGYDLRYYQPGQTDRRADLAAQLQVDLISGCGAGDDYKNTGEEPLLLFSAEEGGGETAYRLYFTRTAPAGFQSDLRAFAARRSQAEWTGALLEAAERPPAADPLPLPLLGAGAAALLVLVILLLVLLRRYRACRRREEVRLADPDTGLKNLAYLEEVFPQVVRQQTRTLYALVCFHLALDHVGYLSGPEPAATFLRHAAQALREKCLSADLPVAVGGGDLAVLRPFRGEEEARTWAQSVLAEIRAFPLASGALRPGAAAAGVFPLETEYRSLAEALFHARQCALSACRAAEDVQLCGAEALRLCRERWQLLEDFEQGLAREDFQLCLQFFVDAHSFQVVGGEALSRWRHPRRGVLNPDRYIPLLESEHRIGRLDLYGLEKSCALLERLDRQGVRNFFLSCNFSRWTISDAGFVEQCTGIIGRYAFLRKLLILEVTESEQIDPRDREQMLRNIADVRKLGVRVMFDDFGAGFSSFHDLQSYPMDGLKLDKELVDNMWTERGAILLHALVETGHRMGLTILAEGVEEDRQIEALQNLHCDVLQGFRFSIPLPADEAERRILSGTLLRPAEP